MPAAALAVLALSAAERHCLRHAGHVVVRGRPGKLVATVIGGDASGVVLRDSMQSAEEAKAVFDGYDLRLEVSP